MSDGVSVEVVGVEYANRQLRQLGERIGRSVTRKAVRAGGNVSLKATRDEAPRRYGALAAAMRLTVDRDRQTGTESATVSINRRAKRRRRGRRIIPSKYMHLVTGGTKPHAIRPKRKKALAFGEEGVYAAARHSGSRANDYVGRAYDRSKRQALRTFETTYARLANEETRKAAAAARSQP